MFKKSLGLLFAATFAVLPSGARAREAAPILAQSLPQAFADAGSVLRASSAERQNSVLATLYQRLFALRDQKNRKQIQILSAQNIYRIYVDCLKETSPGAISEAEILLEAIRIERHDRSRAAIEQVKLAEAYQELQGINGLLRAMQDIDKEIAFVEDRLAEHGAPITTRRYR